MKFQSSGCIKIQEEEKFQKRPNMNRTKLFTNINSFFCVLNKPILNLPILAILYVLILGVQIVTSKKETKYLKSKFNTEMNLEMYTQASMQFKASTMNLLENLFYSSNFKSLCEEKTESNNFKSESESVSETESERTETYRRSEMFTNAEVTPVNKRNDLAAGKKEEDYYKYYTYNEIVEELEKLANKYKRFIKLETAQKLYNLPNPGGFCGPNNQKCFNHIVFLTDHEVDSKSKHQIYISGEVHGNEQVGPNASIELIKLLLKHSESDPWVKHMLSTRLIVITPMTNPHGYYSNSRTELGIQPRSGSIDVNRDFPYLVEEDQCMKTISARMVNELFISHLFSLGLTLHGGTESLTYPYGAPNHVVGNKNEIPVSYRMAPNSNSLSSSNSKVIEYSEQAKSVVEKYIKGKITNVRGKSSEAPDHQAASSIAKSSSFYCSKSNYRTGDMNAVVYPVTGGMEDWAYAGSWEGSPVITQPCKPNFNGPYDQEKTMYSKNYKDALKSIMFLLEVSHSKIPPRDWLGQRSNNDECILKVKETPFNIFHTNTTNTESLKSKCLEPKFDGYISKVLRLSLTLIDLLDPYITVHIHFPPGAERITVNWAVGGALTVDETYILYKFTNEKSPHTLPIDKIVKNFNNKSRVMNGKAIWHKDFNSVQDVFKVDINVEKDKKYFEVIAFAKVDKDWLKQENPFPKVQPQTHIVNLRNNKDYVAKNNKFVLQGKEYHNSQVYLMDLTK